MLIGLCGYAFAGKDTVADILVERHGFTKMGFADALREVAEALNPIVDCTDYGDPIRYNLAVELNGYDDAKKLYPEVRGILQRLGTEVGRKIFGENFWVDLAMQRRQAKADVVFADVRFPNEADAIWSRAGKVIRINRPGYGPVNDHASERFAGEVRPDFEIWNTGTIEELAYTVKGLVT